MTFLDEIPPKGSVVRVKEEKVTLYPLRNFEGQYAVSPYVKDCQNIDKNVVITILDVPDKTLFMAPGQLNRSQKNQKLLEFANQGSWALVMIMGEGNDSQGAMLLGSLRKTSKM